MFILHAHLLCARPGAMAEVTAGMGLGPRGSLSSEGRNPLRVEELGGRRPRRVSWRRGIGAAEDWLRVSVGGRQRAGSEQAQPSCCPPQGHVAAPWPGSTVRWLC